MKETHAAAKSQCEEEGHLILERVPEIVQTKLPGLLYSTIANTADFEWGFYFQSSDLENCLPWVLVLCQEKSWLAQPPKTLYSEACFWGPAPFLGI